jgi:hypothetical protein
MVTGRGNNELNVDSGKLIILLKFIEHGLI